MTEGKQRNQQTGRKTRDDEKETKKAGGVLLQIIHQSCKQLICLFVLSIPLL